VIDLINKHFVPVYTSNEDFRGEGSAPAEERKELQRIRLAAGKAKMSVGTVHVYLLGPDGQPVGSQHVASASKVENLTELLEKTISQLKVPAGKPLVAATQQSKAPKCDPDALVLHLVARYVNRQGNEEAPRQTKLGESRSAGWGAFPAEDWIVLPKDQWSKLLPADKVKVGTSWELDKETAARILTHVYPTTENNDVKKNKIEEQALKATVIAAKDGVVRARLEGRLKMEHWFYHKADGQYVEAPLVGLIEFEPGKGVRSLQLTTEGATYGAKQRRPFGVVVQAVR
jgi:hypothetical protein